MWAKRAATAVCMTFTLTGCLVLSACTASRNSAKESTGKHSLEVLIPVAPSGLDPSGENGNANYMAWDNLYDRLVSYPTTAKGGVLASSWTAKEMAPELATSWSHAGLVWTFKLRPNVKSCTGDTMSAADVVYSIGRVLSATGPVNGDYFALAASGITNAGSVSSKNSADHSVTGKVSAINGDTVRITLAHNTVNMPKAFTSTFLPIFDAKAMKQHATAADPWSHKWLAAGAAAGYGPYCLGSYTKGSQYTLKANPNYWRGKPQFTTVDIRTVPTDSARIASLQAGSADVATDLSPSEYSNLRGAQNVTVYGNYIPYDGQWIGMNYKAGPWGKPGNVELRQAVAAAIPYQTIIDTVYGKRARKMNGVVPSTQYGGTAVASLPKSQDLAKAKQLMAQAGYPGGKGLDKYPASDFTLSYEQEQGAWMGPIANQIQTALKSIGIPIQLAVLPAAQYLQRGFANSLAMNLWEGISDFSDSAYSLQLFYASAKAGGAANFVAFSDATVDSAILKAVSSSGAAQSAASAQAQQQIATKLPYVPIVEFQTQIAMRKGLIDWMPQQDIQTRFWPLKSGQ